MAEHRADVYRRITAEIVAAIEAGAGQWKMPWHHDGTAISRPTNISSGRRYRGVNVVALWITAYAAGYGTGIWGKYRQWRTAGAQVRRGERATTVVLWKEARSRDDDESGDEEQPHRARMFARAFSVFNAAQVDGYEPPVPAPTAMAGRIAAADTFVDALKIPTTFGALVHERAGRFQVGSPSEQPGCC
jgi:antirestriction protein ArdC